MPPGADPMLDLLTRMVEAHGLFVYGTLAPKQQRWGLIEDLVGPPERCAVAGRLFDTGWGYPAALFDAAASPLGPGPELVSGAPLVAGWRVEPLEGRAEELAHLALAVEGDLYVPKLVRTTGGATAAAFEWLTATTGMVELPDGEWPAA